MRKPILCLDFDGVLHSYDSGWMGANAVVDGPVLGAVQFLVKAVQFFDVQVYSSRSNCVGGRAAMQTAIEKWCVEELGEVAALQVWSSISYPESKPPAMVGLDDRQITFDGVFPDIAKLLQFQPWNKRSVLAEPVPLATSGSFRKKPVVIEAFQMTRERRASNADWPAWMHEAWNKEVEEPGALFPTSLVGVDQKDESLSIHTLEGNHLVGWGDYIIQGLKGELYPCKPDIFEATYDTVAANPCRRNKQS